MFNAMAALPLLVALPAFSGVASANAGEQDATRFEHDDVACVQVLLARDQDDQLDLSRLSQPRYRVGARAGDASCDKVVAHEFDAAQLPLVMQALRDFKQHARGPGAVHDLLASCQEAGGSAGLSEQAPDITADRLTLWMDACDTRLTLQAERLHDAGRLGELQVSVASVPPAQAAAEGPEPDEEVQRWAPDSGRVDFVAKRETTGEDTEDELKLRLDTTWTRGNHETRLELEVDYERDGLEPWDREANGRLGRIRQFESGWFTIYEGFLERNQLRIQSSDEDYRLLQASGGGGYRWRWDERASLRAALLWNYFYFDLLDLDRSATLDAPSVYLSGQWSISPRLNARATARFYHWPDGDSGTEIDSDLAYDLTKHLGFGLRWRYTRDGASLDRDDEENTEMFLRYRF